MNFSYRDFFYKIENLEINQKFDIKYNKSIKNFILLFILIYFLNKFI
jgi:hypothetical protein